MPIADPIDRDGQPRKSAERDTPRGSQFDRSPPERRPVVPRVDVADLAADDPDAVVVELVAEAQADRVVLVEADRDHQPLAAHDADGLVQRDGRARAFERDRDTVGAVTPLDGRRDVRDAVGLDRFEPRDAAMADREQPVHDVDALGTVGPRDLGGE